MFYYLCKIKDLFLSLDFCEKFHFSTIFFRDITSL